jgi:hypothetical protein
VLAGGETGLFRRRWEHRGPIPAETLAERGGPAYTELESESQKRKFRLNQFVTFALRTIHSAIPQLDEVD